MYFCEEIQRTVLFYHDGHSDLDRKGGTAKGGGLSGSRNSFWSGSSSKRRIRCLNFLPTRPIAKDGATLVKEVLFDGIEATRRLGLGIHGEPRNWLRRSLGCVLTHPTLDIPHLPAHLILYEDVDLR